MKTLYNPKPLLLLSGTVAGSPGSRWELVAKTMCLTQFRCETTIRAGWVFFFHRGSSAQRVDTLSLSTVVLQLVQTPAYLCPTSTWSVTSQISRAVLSSGAAGYHWHSAHRPVCQHNINIRSLTSFTSTVPWCNLWERLSCTARLALRSVRSPFPLAAALTLFLFFTSFFPLWLLRDATLQVLAAVPAILYVWKLLFVQVGRASARKIDRTS